MEKVSEMIIPFPDKKQQQKDLASKFIKDSRSSFAGKNKTGYMLVTWGGDDVNASLYDFESISYEDLRYIIIAALDSFEDEIGG